MSETVTDSVKVAYPSDRNMHRKIFGCFLMSQAFELAYATAWSFTRNRPLFLSLDDVLFLHPVDIGSVLEFRAQETYAPPPETKKSDGTSFKSFVVAVRCDVIEPAEGTRKTTNTFSFIFTSSESRGSHLQPPILLRPETFLEAIEFLDGKRRWEAGWKHINEALESSRAVEW
ncbi:Thioesterase/thiol ester dehydrase-isomerase [Gonapodya prolifera JEL478]|uniref:Thioesterase/thiol ester dehydrase-isomerase n=1 Tax=Gonapodya prolifera (strain JEL478) TaxID=1344416 RepID=A0A139AG30_GONPJ|nr:Thioesterase/thiol ester dehydrase-isomerase [Gonapodya prolifera JEL478]|eukprot:KXS15720.1 Thioesterase/thiol ester dehydrase-isomerase [Gonapodya prolifera JEL478]